MSGTITVNLHREEKWEALDVISRSTESHTTTVGTRREFGESMEPGESLERVWSQERI